MWKGQNNNSRIVAVLGPTNTGKTHLALERMLGHGSGIMGFPLRLLARENYDRARRLKPKGQVALITGEEKIVPPHAKYFFCTVEAMPLGKPVSFLAIDEIQMCADPDRGHVFTDRLLHARGEDETMFLGAETIRRVLVRLIPEIEFQTRPRLSTLSFAEPRKIQRLPARSAVVGFSAMEVYAIAEIIRHQRGGAAIVMGALSPRTRNAQVELFQNGEVDYLVATDAIGMGLNLDVEHVVFADLAKFDGRVMRDLRADELAQIAGRAGRHMSNGSFVTTADGREMSRDLVERIENHRFDPLRALHWRNRKLDFSSIADLQASLAVPPATSGLIRVREADDERALSQLAKDEAIAGLANDADGVGLLWQVAGVPDFRKTASDGHIQLLARLYRELQGPQGRLDNDWIAQQVDRVARTEGNIDVVMDRIAGIRIWTYISHQAGWLAEADYWREKTRAVEEALSDALHQLLTQRFVDHRTAILVRRLKNEDGLTSTIAPDGAVSVEGHFIGRLEGFRFIADEAQSGRASRVLSSAAMRVLGGELARRAGALAADNDKSFKLGGDGIIQWTGYPVARLTAGSEPLKPDLRLLHGDRLETAAAEAVEARLRRWLNIHIKVGLAPLFRALKADLEGAARGLVYQLVENLGLLECAAAASQLGALKPGDYARLRRLNIHIGRESIYIAPLLKPRPTALSVILWAAHQGMESLPEPPPPGRVSITPDKEVPPGLLMVAGYRVLGCKAIRVDILERVMGKIRSLESVGDFSLAEEVLTLAGCTADEMGGVLKALGYKMTEGPDGARFARPARPGRGKAKSSKKVRAVKPKADPTAHSPFAKLKDLAPPT